MKTLSQVRRVNEAKSLDVQEDAIGYIGAGDLKKYLDIANKFISDDTKSIINYIIDNNDKFGAKDSLQNFYSRGIPKDETLKSIYKAIGKLKKSGRLLEIYSRLVNGETLKQLMSIPKLRNQSTVELTSMGK